MEKETMELELLEFKAGGNSYGINISDIKEILPYKNKSNTTVVPNSHPLIEGIIMPREFIISIVNLTKSLKLSEVDEYKNEMLIVTSMNDLNIAFHVDSVSGIQKVTNTDITKPGKKVSTTVKGVVIGILKQADKKIEILELRSIINDINPDVRVG